MKTIYGLAIKAKNSSAISMSEVETKEELAQFLSSELDWAGVGTVRVTPHEVDDNYAIT